MSDAAPRPLPSWLPTAGVALALAGLVTLSFLERMAMLDASPFPVGVDGYYYAIQLRSLLETGALAYPASPVAFWLMAPLAAATDPITGAKLGAALLGALVALPAYGVGARLGRCRGAGLVAAVLATTSAGSAFLTIEFVKNGVGLTLLLTALWLLLRALERPSVARIALAVLGAGLAVFAHKMAAALLVAFAIPAVLSAAAARGRLRGRRLLYAIGLVVIATGALAVLGLALPRRLPSLADQDLARALFGGTAAWDAPALVTRSGRLTFGHEALVAALLGLAGAAVLSRPGRRALAALADRLSNLRRVTDETVRSRGVLQVVADHLSTAVRGEPTRRPAPGETAVAWTAVILAIATAWPLLDVTDAQGLGFRLRVAAFVPMALAAAVVAGQLFARVRRRDLVLAGIALALVLRTPGRRDEGRIQAHPAMVAAVAALASHVAPPGEPAGDRVAPGDTLIVPERHIVFMVAWYVGADGVRVQLRPDGVPPERRWRLVPLAWIGMGSPLDHALLAARTGPRPPIGLHPRHPNGLVLMHESTYQRVLASLPADLRGAWSRWRTI